MKMAGAMSAQQVSKIALQDLNQFEDQGTGDSDISTRADEAAGSRSFSICGAHKYRDLAARLGTGRRGAGNGPPLIGFRVPDPERQLDSSHLMRLRRRHRRRWRASGERKANGFGSDIA